MQLNEYAPRKWRVAANAALLTLLSQMLIPTGALAQQKPTPTSIGSSNQTKTPIQHVIVIIGENRTFDHVFATYKPTIQGETIDNLLSKQIVQEDGSPGPNFGLALQFSAIDKKKDGYQISPDGLSLYPNLPTPLVGGPTIPFFSNVGDAERAENGLAPGYYRYLTTGGTGLPARTPDTRIENVFDLAARPFPAHFGQPRLRCL